MLVRFLFLAINAQNHMVGKNEVLNHMEITYMRAAIFFKTLHYAVDRIFYFCEKSSKNNEIAKIKLKIIDFEYLETV